MVAKANIFDLIEQLSQSLPFDSAKVAQILGTQLEADPEEDSPVLSSYLLPEGGESTLFDSVELRVPDPSFGSGGGMLSATLKEDIGIDSQAIFNQYGLEFQQEVPSPRTPPGIPAYYNYELPWGTLSLGVTNDDADKLVSFIMKPKEMD